MAVLVSALAYWRRNLAQARRAHRLKIEQVGGAQEPRGKKRGTKGAVGKILSLLMPKSLASPGAKEVGGMVLLCIAR